MSREELEDLASAKETTPDALLRLMEDQAYFEREFNQDWPINPDYAFQFTSSGWFNNEVIKRLLNSEPGQQEIGK